MDISGSSDDIDTLVQAQLPIGGEIGVLDIDGSRPNHDYLICNDISLRDVGQSVRACSGTNQQHPSDADLQLDLKRIVGYL